MRPAGSLRKPTGHSQHLRALPPAPTPPPGPDAPEGDARGDVEGQGGQLRGRRRQPDVVVGQRGLEQVHNDAGEVDVADHLHSSGRGEWVRVGGWGPRRGQCCAGRRCSTPPPWRAGGRAAVRDWAAGDKELDALVAKAKRTCSASTACRANGPRRGAAWHRPARPARARWHRPWQGRTQAGRPAAGAHHDVELAEERQLHQGAHHLAVRFCGRAGGKHGRSAGQGKGKSGTASARCRSNLWEGQRPQRARWCAGVVRLPWSALQPKRPEELPGCNPTKRG